MHDRDAELNALIDAALSDYADSAYVHLHWITAQVNAGIEKERIRRQRRRWIWWLAGAPALVCGLIICLFVMRNPYMRKPMPQQLQSSSVEIHSKPEAQLIQNRFSASSTPEIVRTSKIFGKKQGVSEFKQAERVLPKLDVFPTPAPATGKENALAAFANQSSQAEKQAAWNAQQQTTQPLEIAKIYIAPLEQKEHN